MFLVIVLNKISELIQETELKKLKNLKDFRFS
jgi:hypothetical protein